MKRECVVMTAGYTRWDATQAVGAGPCLRSWRLAQQSLQEERHGARRARHAWRRRLRRVFDDADLLDAVLHDAAHGIGIAGS